jgi:hypothetical protein
VNISIDAKSKSDDGWRLLEELVVTCAGAELVEDELVVPEDGKLVTTPADVAEDWGATEGVGVLVLIGTGAVFVLADTWLVTCTFTVGVAAVVCALASTTLVCETGKGTTVSVLVLVGAATSDCALWALQKEINGANSGSTYVCSVVFEESPLAVTHASQAWRSDSKAEPAAQRAAVLPTFWASM